MSNQPWNTGQPPQGPQPGWQQPQPQGPTYWQQPPPPPRRGGGRTLLLIVAIIVAAAVVGVAAYLLMRPSGGGPTPGTSSAVTTPSDTIPPTDPDNFPELLSSDLPARIGDWVMKELPTDLAGGYYILEGTDDGGGGNVQITVHSTRLTRQWAVDSLTEKAEVSNPDAMCGLDDVGDRICYLETAKFGVIAATTFDEAVTFEELAVILDGVASANS